MATRQRGIEVDLSAVDNTARAFASLDERVKGQAEQIRRLNSLLASGGPGQALANGMSHAVPEIAAASGAIREFEGNLPIRAVERFLSTTLGLGPLLAKAFPLVGAIAFGGVIVDNVEKLHQVAKAAAMVATEIQKGFAQLNAELMQSNAQLNVTNDKLEDDIAKLEKKPGDGLRTALDEASAAAQRLGMSLDKDLDKVKELLEKNQVGFWGGLLSGTGETKDTANLAIYQKSQIDNVRREYDGVVARARESGDKGNIAQAEQQRLVALQKAYDTAEAALANAQSAAQKAQDFHGSANFGGAIQTKASGLTFSSANDNSANLNILGGAREMLLQEQKEIGEDFRHGQDEQKKNALEGAKASGDIQRKEAEAQQKLNAARATLIIAQAKDQAAKQKAADDEQLDALEEKHRRLEDSDQSYYAERERLQDAAVQAQRDAISKDREAVQSEIAGTSGPSKDAVAELERQTKLVGLQAKLVDLDARDAALTAEQAKNARIRVDADTDLGRRKTSDADKLSSGLEARMGGSVDARQLQSRDEYRRRRQELIAEFGGADNQPVRDLDAQQGLDQASIGARGADETFAGANASITSQRSNVDDAVRRGQTSSLAAQQQKIQLDRDEADAMQPVLAAYERIAQLGDLSAAERVSQLRSKIEELRNPVNEVATEIRTQLDSAFEKLFENLDRGKKAWEDFGRMLESDVMKDAYQRLIEPGLQAGLGLLIPNGGRDFSKLPGAKEGGATSALAGLGAKLFPGLPGVGGAKSGSGVTIQIVNQSPLPVEAMPGAGKGGGGDDQQDYDKFVSFIIRGAESGSSWFQMLTSGGAQNG